MALEDIIAKINEDASLKAEQILTEAENKKAEIISSRIKDAEKIKEDMVRKALEKGQKERESTLALAKLSARKHILKSKQSIVSKVYDKVLEDLRNLPLKDYQKLIENILVENASGDEEVIIADSDKDRISQKFIDKVNKKLISRKKKGKLTLSVQTRKFDKGLILRKGKLEINYSFSNLLKSLRDKTESEVVTTLFGRNHKVS